VPLRVALFQQRLPGGGARAQPERTGPLGRRLSCAIPLRSCLRRTAPRREGKGCFRATEPACVDEPAQLLNRLAAPCRPDNSIPLFSASHNLPRLGSAVRISSPVPNFLKKIKEATAALGTRCGLHRPRSPNCKLSVSSRKASFGYHSAFSAARKLSHPTIRLTLDAHRAAMVDGRSSCVPIPQAVPRALILHPELLEEWSTACASSSRGAAACLALFLRIDSLSTRPGGGRHAGALWRHGVSAPVMPK
jgi:hypothetical protein